MLDLDLAQQETEVDLGVVEVAHQRREREEEERHRDEDLRDALAEHRGHRLLHDRRTLGFVRERDAGGEDDERGKGTDNHRVDEDREHLDEALLGGVRDGGGGSRVGSRTDAGLVGVEATLDAEHHRRAGERAEHRLEIESVGEDRREHVRDVVVVDGDDDRADTQVDDRHDRNEQSGDVGEATRAAQNRNRHENGENAADGQGGPRGGPGELLEGFGNVVGSQQVEATHVGQDENNGEEIRKPVLLQRHLNVVGRTTVGVVGAALLVDLGERGLDEGRGAAQGCDNPHPEDCAGAACGDGDRDTGDVADAHARGRGDHQRAEGGDAAFLLRRLHDDADPFLEEAQGQRARANEEVQADAYQKREEHVRIHKVRDRAESDGKIKIWVPYHRVS